MSHVVLTSVKFFLEITFMLNSNTLDLYMNIYIGLFGRMLFSLFAKRQTSDSMLMGRQRNEANQKSSSLSYSSFFCRILRVKVCEQRKHAGSIHWFWFSCLLSKPKSVFPRFFVFNGYSKFTALSFHSAIDQRLGSMLKGVLDQIPTVSNFSRPISVHLLPKS